MPMCEAPCIAVVGATGAVGREALDILASRGWPADRIVPMASSRSAGNLVPYGSSQVQIRPFDLDATHGATHALLCAGSDLACRYARQLAARGLVVVDNSSALRANSDVALIVPEVNGHEISPSGCRLAANPNCSTILLAVALEPWRRAFGLHEIVVSTYQAVSGAGRAGLAALERETRAALDGLAFRPHWFPSPCAFNVFPHESDVDLDSGLCSEELKMIRELARLWPDEQAVVIPSCARVPVRRAHSQSVLVTLDMPVAMVDALDALRGAPGVVLHDDPASPPTPLDASGGDLVRIGRVRLAPGSQTDVPTSRFQLWLCGDQLRKGAALNAIQVLELLDPRLISPATANRGRSAPVGRPNGRTVRQ